MTALRFDKIEGTGNDFIVVSELDAPDVDWSKAAPELCDRHHGVGADGILLVGSSSKGDLRMRLINADGSEAEMCGNGIRCTAKYALDRSLTNRHSVQWETGAGMVHTEVIQILGRDATVRVNMGKPRLRPAEVPVDAAGEEVADVRLEVAGTEVTVTCVGMGNPHAVAFVDSVASFPLELVGPQVERHAVFPKRTNFEIVEVLDPGRIRMRVWERGVGETLSCGTGACAAAVAARLRRGAAPNIEVELPGGRLNLHWEEGSTVLLSGPARTVFRGTLNVDVPRGSLVARGA